MKGESVSGKDFFDQLNFPRLIECHLNPYKICQVVLSFVLFLSLF